MEKVKVEIIDTRFRTVVKAISWRILATLTTMCIAYVVTKSVDDAVKIGFSEVVLKLLVYYIHERAWLQIKWSRRIKRLNND